MLSLNYLFWICPPRCAFRLYLKCLVWLFFHSLSLLLFRKPFVPGVMQPSGSFYGLFVWTFFLDSSPSLIGSHVLEIDAFVPYTCHVALAVRTASEKID